VAQRAAALGGRPTNFILVQVQFSTADQQVLTRILLEAVVGKRLQHIITSY